MSLLPSITVGNEIIQPKGKAHNIEVTFELFPCFGEQNCRET
jgi:hypothetical protein